MNLPSPSAIVQDIRNWATGVGKYFMLSAAVHAILMVVATLILGTITVAHNMEAPMFDTNLEEANNTKIENFDLSEIKQYDPGQLTTESLTDDSKPTIDEQSKKDFSDDPEFEMQGGGAGKSLSNIGGGDFLLASGVGPSMKGKIPGLPGLGDGKGAGSGGAGEGFGGRENKGRRKAQAGSIGGTKDADRAVSAALNWIARHQNPDGSWSLQYTHVCRDKSCTGPGSETSDAAATAMALLPYLAAGQTHKSKGPYQKTIAGGLKWLAEHQKPDGDLSNGAGQTMYTHGLCAICMCEAYGLSKDKQLGNSAQLAIDFIQKAQHPKTGGWRYKPGQEGDTSVVGWQVMSLKSAHMAGLNVNNATLEGSKNWLKSCAKGASGGQFSYEPGSGPSPAMTAVGLLCSQYNGLKREDPAMTEGVNMLMASMPNPAARNIYYWYYATQVLHNVPGPNWDKWNRAMRHVLIDTQTTENTCSQGSWDPDKPTPDAWGPQGGRLMVTSLSALSLEVYYRYLPLYKLDRTDGLDDKVKVGEKNNLVANPNKDKPAAKTPEKPAAAKPAEKPADKAEAKDAAKPEAAKPDAAKPDAPKADAAKPDAPKADAAKPAAEKKPDVPAEKK